MKNAKICVSLTKREKTIKTGKNNYTFCYFYGIILDVKKKSKSNTKPVFSRVLRPCLRGAYIRILPASEMGLSCGQRAHFSALFL